MLKFVLYQDGLVMEEKEREEEERRELERQEEVRGWRSRRGSGDSALISERQRGDSASGGYGPRGSLLAAPQGRLPLEPPCAATTLAHVEHSRTTSTSSDTVDSTQVLNGLPVVSAAELLARINRNHVGEKKKPMSVEGTEVSVGVRSVQIERSDKASQFPEVPETNQETAEPDGKKTEEVESTTDEDRPCLVDCLYFALQCCDCSIM